MKLILASIMVLLAGCTHSVHLSHQSDFMPNAPTATAAQKQWVEVRAEQRVILGFAFDTDYVDDAYNQLQQHCEGELAAVNTQFSTSHGFFYWTNKIRMKGVCLTTG